MEDKQHRHKILRQVIESEQPASQDEICRALRKRGFKVTQSSVSRDLKALGVVRTAERYVFPGELLPELAASEAASGSHVLSVTAAGPNLIVVKTVEGAAQLVADRLDDVSHPGLVGTVAGDDTIFVAVASRKAQQAVMKLIG